MENKKLNIVYDDSVHYTKKEMVNGFNDETYYEIDYELHDINNVIFDDQKYFIFVVYQGYLSEYIKIENDIPLSDLAKEKLKNHENLHLIILIEHEADIIDTIPLLEKKLTEYQIRHDKVYFINGNHVMTNTNYDTKINLYVTNRLHRVSAKNMFLMVPDYDFITEKENFFMCINRIPRQHRVVILAFLNKKDYLRDTDWSLLKAYNLDYYKTDFNHMINWLYTTINVENIKELQPDIEFVLKNKIQKSKYELNYDVEIGEHGFDWDKTYYENNFRHSYVNIVNESQFQRDNTIHITEKSLIPLYYSQIPLFVATHNHVKTLRNDFNFDVFDDIIDHSYDNIVDPKKRMLAIFDEIERLYNNKENIKQKYKELEVRFINNKNKVIDMYKNNIDSVFFKNLLN